MSLTVLNRIQNIPWRGLLAWLFGNRLRILMYHSIADNLQDPHAIPPDVFVEQMSGLSQKRYQVISLEAGLRRLRQGLPLRRYIVLTFDDAYRDFLIHALPVLKQFSYPATLFVPTGLLGKTAFWDTYDRSKPLLDWGELSEISHMDVAIASHTVNHSRLTECDDQKLEYELKASLGILRERLYNVFPALTYPGGYHGPREHEAARRAGYACALGTSSRWGNGPETDVYQLRREKPVP